MPLGRIKAGAGVAVASLGVLGCDLGLRFHLPQVEERLIFRPREALATVGPIWGKILSLGAGERIPTSRNFLGAIARAVNPYGGNHIVFESEIRNGGSERLTLVPELAKLETKTRSLSSLGLEDFKKAWPTYPITDSDMAKDQAVAFTFVLRSLLLPRHLMAGEVARGRLAFPDPAGARGLAILWLPLRRSHEKLMLRFEFEIESP